MNITLQLKSVSEIFLNAVYKIKLVKFLEKLSCTPATFLRFLHLQLFLTLISWPILLYWGLPLSFASPLGNLIFAPFLTVFLFLSSLIFFCELFTIPHSLFVWALEAAATFWSSISAWAQRSWLVGYAQPSLIVGIAIPLIACIIVHHKVFTHKGKSILLLSLFILISIISLKYAKTSYGTITIPCFGKELVVLHSKEGSLLIDSGILGRRVSAPSWVTYTLLPTLIKQGITSLDYFIALKPSTVTFRALTQLIKKLPVKQLYCVTWQGSLSNSGWQAWHELLYTLKYYHTDLIFIEDKEIKLISDTISLIPQKDQVKKNKLSYPLVIVQGTVLDKEIALKNQ